MRNIRFHLLLFFFMMTAPFALYGKAIDVGADVFFQKKLHKQLQGKRVALVTNHTAINKQHITTLELVKKHAQSYSLTALFAPEHGIDGNYHASDHFDNAKGPGGIPIYSLHGATRRPTADMLHNIDVILFDIMDVGVRSYTYVSTLCYVMEEAAKRHIPVIVFDRPNPINGITVDGPILEPALRSFIGYLAVPLCHGMTMGELARFFNSEYAIGCSLQVIPMRGWKRAMSFKETGLPWAPMSPHIPEPDTPLFYAMTNLLPEIFASLNHGVGYTLPFKVLGAPWIDADALAASLNKQKLPGLHFHPLHYRPFYGALRNKDCHGVIIMVTNKRLVAPLSTQFAIIEVLKGLYPSAFHKGIERLKKDPSLFLKGLGSHRAYDLILQSKSPSLPKAFKPALQEFMKVRKKYLLSQYA